MMSPPTLPQPNPSVETVRPVLPSLRRSIGRSSLERDLEADGDAVQHVVADPFRIRRARAAGEYALPPGLHEAVSAEQRRVRREPPGEPRAHAEAERHRPGLAHAQTVRARRDEHGPERQIGLDRADARGARRGDSRPAKLEVERDAGAPEIGVDDPVGRAAWSTGIRVVDRDDRPRTEIRDTEAR